MSEVLFKQLKGAVGWYYIHDNDYYGPFYSKEDAEYQLMHHDDLFKKEPEIQGPEFLEPESPLSNKEKILAFLVGLGIVSLVVAFVWIGIH